MRRLASDRHRAVAVAIATAGVIAASASGSASADDAGAVAPAIGAGSGAAATAPAPGPRFIVRIANEIVRTQPNGITRIERWEDTMTRDGDTVWTERTLAGAGSGSVASASTGSAFDRDHDHGLAHDHHHDRGPEPAHGHRHGHDQAHARDQARAHDQPDGHGNGPSRDDDQARAAASGYRGHGHRHFDSDRAARWVERRADGSVTLSMVDRADRAVVTIPRAEFSTLGFDGRFDAAASLVPATVIRTMAVDAEAAPVAMPVAARWYVDRADGWVHRVLWSEPLQLALRIESRRDDGSVSRTADATVVMTGDPVASHRPWQAVADYDRRRYDEYLD